MGGFCCYCVTFAMLPGARWHHLLPCASQKIVHRSVGVVDRQHSAAVLFAAVKGAYDMSLKISSFFAFVV